MQVVTREIQHLKYFKIISATLNMSENIYDQYLTNLSRKR